MTKEWVVKCKDCGQEFGYSDWSYKLGESRGQSRPERCPECRKKHNRQTGLMGLSYFELKPKANVDTSKISSGTLGSLSHLPREHTAKVIPSGFDPTKFGVTDDDVRALFAWFEDPRHQVAIVVGPTGSGKSTALPFRLIHPPDGIPEDRFTRYGQVLITQPRIQATRNIPAYVAKDLYGSSIGSGYDVGFRYKNNPFSDWRNRLVYATDGTLINWIVSGQIANLSVIMIDEAHERSLNIDLILGLLKKLLPTYPHLKLIVASATIDSGLFLNYFGPETATLIEFQGKRKFNVDTYFRDPEDCLPYEELPKLLKKIPQEVANEVVWLLEEIECGNKPTGDVLAFLQGERPIEEAVSTIRQAVKGRPKLANVDVFPLYTTLRQEDQNKALLPKPDPSRRRVVVTTNVAETSLTVEDIVYVVDSGLINEAQWDPTTKNKQVVTVRHSQAGCKQRWGRGGRVRDGQAYCLYTEEQFEHLFPEFTVPQIQRSDLEALVLAAKAAGIDDLSRFDWIQRPPDEELRRAPEALQKIGALDGDGYLTEHGLELQSFAEEPALAHLMAMADRFACAVEMATLIAIMKLGGVRYLLKNDRNWDADTRRAVDRIHRSMKVGCKDDIEFCLKLYAAWSDGNLTGRNCAPRWAVLQQWRRLIPPLTKDMKEYLGDREEDFRQALLSITDTTEIASLVAEYSLADLAGNWSRNAQSAYRNAGRRAWGKAFFINESHFREKIEPERNTLLDALSGHKKEDERRPIDFGLLDKIRILMAFSLKSRIYERVPTPEEENEDGDAISASYQPYRGVEDTSHDTILDYPHVQINGDSVLYGTCPQYFVCAKQQLVVHPISPGTPAVPVMHVSFLSLVRPEWLANFSRLGDSIIALGRYLASETRDPATGMLPHMDALPRSLFLDQLLPIGTRYEGRAVAQLPNGMWDVQLIDQLREAGEVLESFKKEQSEPDTERESSDVEDGTDLVDTVLTEADAPVKDPEEEAIPPWADLVEELSDPSENSSLVEPEYSTELTHILDSDLAVRVHVLPGDYHGHLMTERVDFQLAEVVPVQVAEFAVVDGQLTPRLAVVPDREPFEAFTDQYQEGTEVVVQVTGYDERPGDTLISLIVRENETGLEALMQPDAVAFANRGFVIKAIPIGIQMAVVVDRIDERRGRVHLSALPALEKDLDTEVIAQRSRNGVYEADAVVKDIAPGKVYLMLDWSKPEQGLIHATTVFERGLHKGTSEQYRVGELCKIRFQFSQYDSHVALEEVPEEVQPLLGVQGAFKSLYWESGRLHCRGRMTYNALLELRSKSSAHQYAQALNTLYVFSNQFFSSTIDVDWREKVEQKYPVGTWVEGVIADVVEFGAFVELEPGIKGLLHKKEIRWGGVEDPSGAVTVGDRVFVIVIQVDIEQQKIGLSLLNPEHDPFRKYQKGGRANGKVIRLIDVGAIVELEPGVAGLVHKSKMWSTRDVGDEVAVEILEIDLEKRRMSLSTQLPENDPLPKYREGDVKIGVVTGIKDFGAFVELEPGAFGLLHSSKIPNGMWPTVGTNITVRIINLDRQNRKMGFALEQSPNSMRRAW